MKRSIIRHISIVGSGNVGYHLSQRLQQKGLVIDQVFSRKEDKAKVLAEKLEVCYTIYLSDIQPISDLYILAVSDNAILEVSQHLSKILPKNSLIVHTSGATPSSVLETHFPNHGIFYPLQSFSKEKAADFEHIPICIDASNLESLGKLRSLAQQISPSVYDINDQQRAYLHVAAVFANNFTNYFFHVAYELSLQHEVPFELLRPLILETAQKVQHYPPAQMQTGPAIRADEITMKRHLSLLEEHPNWKALYEALSSAIQNIRTIE